MLSLWGTEVLNISSLAIHTEFTGKGPTMFLQELKVNKAYVPIPAIHISSDLSMHHL